VLIDLSMVGSVLEVRERRGPRAGSTMGVQRGASVVSSSVMGGVCMSVYEDVV
jgi:hypothetical protein